MLLLAGSLRRYAGSCKLDLVCRPVIKPGFSWSPDCQCNWRTKRTNLLAQARARLGPCLSMVLMIGATIYTHIKSCSIHLFLRSGTCPRQPYLRLLHSVLTSEGGAQKSPSLEEPQFAWDIDPWACVMTQKLTQPLAWPVYLRCLKRVSPTLSVDSPQTRVSDFVCWLSSDGPQLEQLCHQTRRGITNPQPNSSDKTVDFWCMWH